MTTHRVPRAPSAQAQSDARMAYRPSELVALSAHDDATVARLAEEALAAQVRVRVRVAAIGGAPTHLRVVEGGLVHVLGSKPEPPEAA